VALVRTYILEEHLTSIIRVKRITLLVTMLVTVNAVTSLQILFTLMMEVMWCQIPEGGILHNMISTISVLPIILYHRCLMGTVWNINWANKQNYNCPIVA
jgi:hypothetical protein